ncbi:MAG: SoxY-related AACIE arm protein [Betaproteobacteria bacterium]
MPSRREFISQVSTSSIAALVTAYPITSMAQIDPLVARVRAYAGVGNIKEGRVKLEIASLVDNGNSVPIEVKVSSAMREQDRVVGIAVFNEKNPQPEIAEFVLGPRTGRAHVSTRIRLATTQRIVAVAKMVDGSCWTHTVEVVVTLAACLDE